MERLSFKCWVGLIGQKLNLPTLINRVTGDFRFMGLFFLQVNMASLSLCLFLLLLLWWDCFYNDCWRSGATSMVTTVK